MRTGPGRNYPGIWLYKRRDLPIRVVQIYPNWRKIEDPDGEQGWMLVTLLSDRRTGIVKPGEPRDDPRQARGQRAGPLSRRAWRGRAAREMRRQLVPHRDRQARRLYRAGRHLGRRRRGSVRRLSGEAVHESRDCIGRFIRPNSRAGNGPGPPARRTAFGEPMLNGQRIALLGRGPGRRHALSVGRSSGIDADGKLPKASRRRPGRRWTISAPN